MLMVSLDINYKLAGKYLTVFSGWVCFVVSIIFIGILTAFIGDVAAHFGCTIGLKDAVTAITLVAMGTSLPGNFLLKTEQEDFCNAKIV